MLIRHVFRYLIAKMAPKNSPRETPLMDNSRAIKRRNGDVVSKFLWRSRESIAEIRLNGDRPLETDSLHTSEERNSGKALLSGLSNLLRFDLLTFCFH